MNSYSSRSFSSRLTDLCLTLTLSFLGEGFMSRIPSSWLRFLWFMVVLGIASFSLIAGQGEYRVIWYNRSVFGSDHYVVTVDVTGDQFIDRIYVQFHIHDSIREFVPTNFASYFYRRYLLGSDMGSQWVTGSKRLMRTRVLNWLWLPFCVIAVALLNQLCMWIIGAKIRSRALIFLYRVRFTTSYKWCRIARIWTLILIWHTYSTFSRLYYSRSTEIWWVLVLLISLTCLSGSRHH